MDNSNLFEILLAVNIPQQLIIEKSGQTIVSNLTWNDIFNHIKSEHWHRSGKHTCPHLESLYDHLQKCASICYEKAVRLGYTKQECIKAYFTGLLHDIGKPGSRKLVGDKHTAFKGHGLIGGAMLEDLYSDELFTLFGLTREDWADISTCADVHMCSCYSNPEQSTPLHQYSVNILPDSVKKMLIVLRTGDKLGRTLENTTFEEEKMVVDSGDVDYFNTLFGTIPFETLNKNKGVLIMVQGGSSVGKSTFVNNLTTKLGVDKVVHIMRDWYMCYHTLKNSGMNSNISKSDIIPSLYQPCYAKYIASNKKWAIAMNNHMMKDIYEGLQMGKIVIVDTMATMFDSINAIIPEIAGDAYRISFWLHRNTIITESETSGRLGMTMKDQLAAHGDTNLFNRFNNSISWKSMVSTTEGAEDHYTQPHLSISVGWTGMKNNIIDHICDKILTMYQYNMSIPRVPVMEQTMDMTLIELVQTLMDTGGMDCLVEFFKQYHYTVSKHIPGVVGIKYLDGINQIWRPKWAREARGRFYYVGGSKVVALKDTLQRGIEVLTKAHNDSGINETQDIDLKTLEKLDPIQQQIMKTFSGENSIETFITGKVDGSLLIVNVYPIGCEQYDIINMLAMTHGDTFTKSIVSYCMENGLPTITVATQGTLFIGEDMQDYFLTAIQSLGLVGSWTDIIPQFVAMFVDYTQGMDQMCNICFEAYCKNRLTISGRLHTELAVGYDHNGFNLLGMMYYGKYIPHFEMPRKTFKQPFYYKVTNTREIFHLMDCMDKVVLGTMTEQEFLANFNMDMMTSSVFHPEGFVMLTPTADGFDYEKIKTTMYYKCHKVRQTKVKEMLSYPMSCAKYYPILVSLHTFFDNTATSINNLVTNTMDALTSNITKSSPFYIKQNQGAQKRFNEVLDGNMKNIGVVYKMMLNSRPNMDDLTKLISPITMKLYNTESESIITFTKNLLMKVDPWFPSWETRLESLFGSFDDAVNELYSIVIGFN